MGQQQAVAVMVMGMNRSTVKTKQLISASTRDGADNNVPEPFGASSPSQNP